MSQAESDAALFGLDIEFDEPEPEMCELWLECESAFAVFLACRTQWRYHMSGIGGLDYAAVIPMLDVYNIKQKDKRQVMDDITALEQGALNAFNERAAKQSKK